MQENVEEAVAGDIVSIAGLSDSYVNHTICNPLISKPLEVIIAKLVCTG